MTRINRGRLGAALALLAVAGAALTGCAQGSNSPTSCTKTSTIGFSHPSGQAAFVKALKEQVGVQARKAGCVKILLDNTQNESLENQRATLESWVQQKLDAIVVLPVDTASVESLRKQAQAQGTKWLTYAGPTDGGDGWVGFDSDASGTAVAEDALKWLKSAHPNGGVSAAITTSPLAPFKGRFTIPKQKFKDAGVDVVSYQQCLDQACGLQIAESTLLEHPNLRVFIGLNDDAALGALRAFNNAGIDPKETYIAGQDGNVEGLKAVKAGGAYRASAAIVLSGLAKAIVDTSLKSIKGSKNVKSEVGVELATTRDTARLNELIAQFG